MIEPDIFFDMMGLKLSDISDINQFYLGLQTQWKENKLFITKLENGFGAYASGLNVHDEIISIDGCEVMEGFEKIYADKKTTDIILFTISRQGILKEITVPLTPDTRKQYKIEFLENPSEQQQRLLKKWLPS
jgi:predicted metalloprotease with PDZ domain